MAASNTTISSLDLTKLDFFSLKNSFKNAIKGNPLFADFDFSGAAINLLLEILARNSYQNGFFTNMLFSEGFLDSAQLRNSLYSHAKELNYLPRSSRSAKATVSITFESSGESQPYVIPKGSQFATLIKADSYTFTMPETVVAVSSNNTFTFQTDLYEGVYLKDQYVYSGSIGQRFTITNPNVDTSSITVVVYEDGDQVGDVYTVTNTLLDLNDQSKVFFVQTGETGNYEVFFGDGVLGRQPKLNSVVIIDYRISSGSLGNGARSFSVDFDPTGANELLSTPVLTVLQSSQNGSDPEDNESIRYYAPRAFQVQERAVTTSDYEILLKTQFPEISAVSVYGGEEIDPPQFGRVFVAVNILNVDGLPDSKKDEYTDFLSRRSPFAIEPTIVEPDITYLGFDIAVRYNLNVTTNSAARIQTIVTSSAINYATTYLNDFNVTFRLSPFSTLIDNSDISIISNDITPYIYKKLNPTLSVSQNININFNIPLVNDLAPQSNTYSSADLKAVSSSIFTYKGQSCLIEDDADGNLRIVKFSSNNTRSAITNIGTVNYSTGALLISNFAPDDYAGNALEIYAYPKDSDISVSQNVLMEVEPDGISVNVTALRI